MDNLLIDLLKDINIIIDSKEQLIGTLINSEKLRNIETAYLPL